MAHRESHSERAPCVSRARQAAGSLLTCLIMPQLVNLSLRFDVQTEVPMSAWLHSGGTSPAMVLQGTWKVHPPQVTLTQEGFSSLSTRFVAAWGPHLPGQGETGGLTQ